MKSKNNLIEQLKLLPYFNKATVYQFGDGNINVEINDKIIALIKGQFENSMTDKLNYKDQILLAKNALLSCELDDLLK